MIQTICPHCSKEFHLPPDLAGRKLRCNGCSEKFRIPGNVVSGTASSSAAITKDRPIETRCPRCLADYTLKPKYAGETVRCKTCRNSFVVPNPNAPEPEPELDDLVDVTPVLSAAKIAPARSTPRPAPTRKPEPEVVELTEDDMVDDSTNGYDLFGDADDMRAAARKGADRSAPAPLSRMAYVPEAPTFTPPKIRKVKRNSGSAFGENLKAIGSGFLSVVIFVTFAYMRYERRRMRNERIRNTASALFETETKTTTVTPRPDPRPSTGAFIDPERVRNVGKEFAREQQERLRQERQSRPTFPRNSGFGPGGPPGFGPGGPPGFGPGRPPGFGPGFPN